MYYIVTRETGVKSRAFSTFEEAAAALRKMYKISPFGEDDYEIESD